MTSHSASSPGHAESGLGITPLNVSEAQKVKIGGLGLALAIIAPLAGAQISMISSYGLAIGSSMTLKVLGLTALATVLGTGGALTILYLALLAAIVGFSFLIYKNWSTECFQYNSNDASTLNYTPPELHDYKSEFNEDKTHKSFNDQRFYLFDDNNKKIEYKGKEGLTQLTKALGPECKALLPKLTYLLASNAAIATSEHVNATLTKLLKDKYNAQVRLLPPDLNYPQKAQTVVVNKKNNSVTIEYDLSTQCSRIMATNAQNVPKQVKAKGTTTYTINQNGTEVNHNYKLLVIPK